MRTSIKIACIGEVMIELLAEEDGLARLGVAGDTYNTAVYLAKLRDSSELEVSYVTALGSDSFSRRILNEIRKHNLKAELIEIRDHLMPGLYAVDIDDKGERSFSHWRENSAARTLFNEPCRVRVEDLSGFDMIYLSGITVAILSPENRKKLIDFLKTFRGNGGKFAFDSNYRPKLWESIEKARDITMQMWSMTDIALPSIDDEQLLFGETSEADTLKRLGNAGVKFGALKRGSSGPKLIGPNDYAETDFEKVYEVVDSTAAGDSFNAGFLSEIAIGNTLNAAAQKGHDLASQVVRCKGAIVPPS